MNPNDENEKPYDQETHDPGFDQAPLVETEATYKGSFPGSDDWQKPESGD